MQKVQKSSATIEVLQDAPTHGEEIMTVSQALIPVLERVLDRQTQPGVSARVLYEFLELNPKVYARWAKKNIVTNLYAMAHIDWEITLHEVEYRKNTGAGGNFAQDYVLSIDFAKRLAMMARSAKGEEARQYFLGCERAVLGRGSLPQVKNPAHQLMIDTVVRLDAFEQELQQHQAQLMTQQQAMLAFQAQQIEALQLSRDADAKADEANTKADLAEAKADTAVNNQNFWTIAEYVQYHDNLRRQCPESAYVEASNHMRAYCKRERLNFRDPNVLPRKIPVGDKNWEVEWGFHVSVYEAAFLPWLLRRNSQIELRVV